MLWSLWVAITKYQTGWLMKNQNLYLTVLEAGSPRSGFQQGRVLVKALFWLQTADFLLIEVRRVERGR